MSDFCACIECVPDTKEPTFEELVEAIKDKQDIIEQQARQITGLTDDRDCWVFNAKVLQKECNLLEVKNKELIGKLKSKL